LEVEMDLFTEEEIDEIAWRAVKALPM